MAVDGDTAVIGAYYDDDTASNSGSAYVFRRSGNNWNQEQKLVASNAGSDDRFGFSVAVDGDTAVIGALREDHRHTNAGAAYVFSRSGTTWSQQKKLTAYDGYYYDYFGYDVAVSGDTAMVGANQDDDRGGSSGSAYIFARSGTTWSLQRKLTASDGKSNDYFGQAVSLDTNTASSAPTETTTGVAPPDRPICTFVPARAGASRPSSPPPTVAAATTSERLYQ